MRSGRVWCAVVRSLLTLGIALQRRSQDGGMALGPWAGRRAQLQINHQEGQMKATSPVILDSPCFNSELTKVISFLLQVLVAHCVLGCYGFYLTK